MKRALSLILALVLCLGLCACGNSGSTAQPEETKKENGIKLVETEPHIVMTDNYKVEYTGYRFVEHYSYMYRQTVPAVELQFRFTNVGSEGESCMDYSLSVQAYQNGVEIDYDACSGTTTQNVLPGYSNECTYTFVTSDKTSPIHVIYRTWNGSTVLKEFDIEIAA